VNCFTVNRDNQLAGACGGTSGANRMSSRSVPFALKTIFESRVCVRQRRESYFTKFCLRTDSELATTQELSVTSSTALSN
jgi:hypothetical protein